MFGHFGDTPFPNKGLDPFLDPAKGIIPAWYNAGVIPDKGEAHDFGNHDPFHWGCGQSVVPGIYLPVDSGFPFGDSLLGSRWVTTCDDPQVFGGLGDANAQALRWGVSPRPAQYCLRLIEVGDTSCGQRILVEEEAVNFDIRKRSQMDRRVVGIR